MRNSLLEHRTYPETWARLSSRFPVTDSLFLSQADQQRRNVRVFGVVFWPETTEPLVSHPRHGVIIFPGLREPERLPPHVVNGAEVDKGEGGRFGVARPGKEMYGVKLIYQDMTEAERQNVVTGY